MESDNDDQLSLEYYVRDESSYATGEEQTLKIVGLNFTGRVVVSAAGLVVDAPPYLRHTRRWSMDRLMRYCSRRRWQVELAS